MQRGPQMLVLQSTYIAVAVHRLTLISQSAFLPKGSFYGQYIAALHQVTT